MKRMKTISLIMAAALLSAAFAACAKSEFGVTENAENRMVITAENAEKDAFLISGSLEAEDGDQIAISAALKEGSVRVEILAAPDEGIDEYPEADGTPILTANLSDGEKVSGEVPEGSYLVKATCLEKATGTVQIEVPDV